MGEGAGAMALTTPDMVNENIKVAMSPPLPGREAVYQARLPHTREKKRASEGGRPNLRFF